MDKPGKDVHPTRIQTAFNFMIQSLCAYVKEDKRIFCLKPGATSPHIPRQASQRWNRLDFAPPCG
jgi:hypothetical protein